MESRYSIQKGIILYLSDWFTPEKVRTVEDVLSRFLDMTGETFTKKRSGRLDAYPGKNCPSGFRNIRGSWQKILHVEFDGEFEAVSSEEGSGFQLRQRTCTDCPLLSCPLQFQALGKVLQHGIFAIQPLRSVEGRPGFFAECMVPAHPASAG